MAFLEKTELRTVASTTTIDKIIANDDTIVTDIINESIALMKSYLAKYYDIDAIFDAIDQERNLNVLKKLKDISIYEIYERHTREQNKVAMRRYSEAMLWLEKLNTGEYYDSTLPPRQIEDGTDISKTSDDIRFGGNTRYINDTIY